MKIPLVVGILAAIPLSIPAQVFAQQSHTFSLRVECRKDSSRGCTASGRICSNAPAGTYFSAGQSVSGQHVSSWSPGRQPICGEATTGADGVVVNGLLAPTSMCAGLHAESGSGMANIGKVAYVECSYTTTVYPIP